MMNGFVQIECLMSPFQILSNVWVKPLLMNIFITIMRQAYQPGIFKTKTAAAYKKFITLHFQKIVIKPMSETDQS
jgi:hypothetical protein